MTLSALNDLLQITTGNLTLSPNTLPDCHFDDLLREYNQSEPLIINGATKTMSDTVITVTGTSLFLKVNQLPVTASFSIDGSGNPVAVIKLALIGDTISPTNWKFSQSFGSLPPFYFSGTDSGYLDSFILSNASFSLCTNAGTDPVTNQLLERGLNFSANLNPSGVLGIFDSILDGTDHVLLEGQIHIPYNDEPAEAVPYGKFPWNMQAPILGINLTASLGIEVGLSDKLKINQTKLNIYTPITDKWLSANKTYQPVAALEGLLSIPSLQANVTVDAYINQQKTTTTIVGNFEGVTFKSLLELVDIANGNGLMETLPKAIQDKIESLDKLTLEQVSITINSSLSSTSISSISVKVGLPGITWNPVSVFEVSGIAADFFILTPFSASRSLAMAIEATLTIAGTPFSVMLQAPEVMLTAYLQRGATIPLKELFQTYLPSLPAPPDLTINDMSFGSNLADDSFNFFMDLAVDPVWTLNVPKTLTIFDVRVEVNKSQQTQASFSGSLEFANNVISVSYTTPGDFMVRGSFPKINVTDIISELCDQTITFPNGFDIELLNSTILIEKVASQDTFFFATQVNNYGVFLFQAVRDAGKTGLAFGFELGSAPLNALNGLSMLKPLEDMFQLSELMLLVTSVDPTTIAFPDLDKFQNPNITAKKLKIPTQSGNNTGFYAYANVVFGSAGGQGTVSKLFGLSGQLAMVLFIGEQPEKNAKFYIDLNFTGHSGVLNGCTIDAQLGALISNGEPGLFLLGTLSTKFGSQPVQFTLELLIVPNGAFISGTVQGSLPSFNITDSLSVTFSQLALEVGVDLEGIPSFGFAGQIDTNKGFDSSVAVFFDSADPAKSLLAGAISDINLYDIVDCFSQNAAEELPSWLADILKEIGVSGLNVFSIDKSYADALDNLDLTKISEAFAPHNVVVSTNIQQSLIVVNNRGSIWSLSTMDATNGITHYQLKLNGNAIDVELEAQLYLAPQNTSIGSITFPEGFKAIGTISVFFLQLTSNTEILPSSGIKINEEINAIKWEIGGIDLFKLTGAGGSGNPTLSMSTFTDNTQKEEDLKAPHFLLSGEISFLDIDDVSVYVNIRKEGMNFDLNDHYFVIDLDVKGSFTKLDDFSVSGTAAFEIGNLNLGAAGSIPINTGVSAMLAIAVADNANTLSLGANASLTIEILGDSFNLVNASLTVSASFFENLPSAIEQLLIDEILKAPLKWLNWVKNGLITITGDVVQVLKDIFNISSWQDVADLMKQVGYDFAAIVSGIAHVFGVAVSDIWNFLISSVKDCAVNSVNALTGNGLGFGLFDYSQQFLSKMGSSADSQQLLYLYYSNQQELEQVLLRNPAIWNNYIGQDKDSLILSDPASATINSLDKLKTVSSPVLTQAIDDSIVILKKYTHLNYDTFREKLNAN